MEEEAREIERRTKLRFMVRDRESESEVHVHKETRGLGHRGGGGREKDTEEAKL